MGKEGSSMTPPTKARAANPILNASPNYKPDGLLEAVSTPDDTGISAEGVKNPEHQKAFLHLLKSLGSP